MISLDELNACLKQQEIIMKNSDDPSERFIALNIANNLKQMFAQFSMLPNRPDFKEMVDEFAKSEETEENT